MIKSRPLMALFRSTLGCSRLEEFESIAHAHHLSRPLKWVWDKQVYEFDGGDIGPPILQCLPSDLNAKDWKWLANTAAKAIGCKAVFEVWAAADTLEECAEQCQQLSSDEILMRIDGNWRMNFAALGANTSFTPEERRDRIERFAKPLACLSKRKVSLNAPKQRLWLIENRLRLRDASPFPRPPPKHMLLYQLPTDAVESLHLMHQIDVKKRAFISTSTLAAERAISLCNLAGVKPNQTVLDPYCGSGGILIAAAALGADTVGSDIDWKPLSKNKIKIPFPSSSGRPNRGKESVCIYDNFAELNVSSPKALIVLDSGAPNAAKRLLKANHESPYDAIICDPPYGRREFQHGHYSWDGSLSYRVDQAALHKTISQLLSLSTQILKPKGKLIFLAPIWTPKDHTKPTLNQLLAFLRSTESKYNLTLKHAGKEVVNQSLARAVVVMENASV